MLRKTATMSALGLLLAFTSLGCDSQALSTPVVVEALAEPEMPRHFSWVVDEQLGGMAHPGFGATALSSYDYLAHQDVSLLISLTEHAADAGQLLNRGIDQLHLPVIDFTAPTLDQLDTFVSLTADELLWGGRVVVHCAAGRGRTGTFLAAWFVANGANADEAIAHVRTLRPGSIETQSQLDVIAHYADLLN